MGVISKLLPEKLIELFFPKSMPAVKSNSWKKDLDNNLKEMYEGNCWGVPSFKITNEDGSEPFYAWGQDRMWLIKEEINKRLI
jgi:2-hydroxychromene-2-carboxylate isomerase